MEEKENQSKKSYSVALPTFLLFIALIAIGVMGYFLFSISKEKETAVSETNNLKSQVDEMKNTIYDMQTQLDSYSKTFSAQNSSNSENSLNSENSSTNKQANLSQIHYEEINEKLNNIDGLYITDVEEKDNKYTLKGVIYSKYTLSKNELNEIVENGKLKLNDTYYTVKKDSSSEENEYVLIDPNSKNSDALYAIRKEDSDTYYIIALAQISDVWKLTDSYKQITVDKSTKVEADYSGAIVSASEEFENFKKSTPKNTTNPSPIYNFEFKNGKCVKIIGLTSAI